MLSRSSLRFSKNFARSSLRAASNDSTAVSLDGFGDHLFKGAVADKYLKKNGLSASTLDNAKWTTDGSADKVSWLHFG